MHLADSLTHLFLFLPAACAKRSHAGIAITQWSKMFFFGFIYFLFFDKTTVYFTTVFV